MAGIRTISLSTFVVIVAVALMTIHRPNYIIIPVVWAGIGALFLGAILLFIHSIKLTNENSNAWPALIMAFLMAVFVIVALSAGAGYVSTKPQPPTPTVNYQTG